MSSPGTDEAGDVTLLDHHCHGVVVADLDPSEFELLITESSDPAPAGTTFFDSQLGLSLRRWCPPVLGLAPHAQPREYLARRRELGVDEVNRRLLRAASVAGFVVDTGYQPGPQGQLTPAAELGAAAGVPAHAVVRLEQVAEELAAAGTAAGEFAARYPAALAETAAAVGAVAVKSVAAYRYGLDVEPGRPAAAQVRHAAAVWLREQAGRLRPRLVSPVLLRFLLWSAIDLGLPIQIHAGFGDRDLTLHRANPVLMTDFIRATQPAGVPLLFLHCYPYHREAGYLAHIYPHVYCDVGLALNFTGARAHAVLAESLELTPFGKAMYSSDAFGLPELHYLGAVVFRRALARVIGDWLRDGALTAADAGRAAAMIGAGNARRVYGLG
jgi:uncharacterized protein